LIATDVYFQLRPVERVEVIMAYATFVFLPIDMPLSLADVELRLRAFFANNEHPDNRAIHIQRQSDCISVTRDRWSLYISTDCRAPAHLDSQTITSHLAQMRPELISRMPYSCRLEIFSDKDRTLDYFNDYVLVVEQLAQLPDAIVYDYAAGTFI
jgi:hypothetical protein